MTNPHLEAGPRILEHAEARLSPCPFCHGGKSRVEELQMWTGAFHKTYVWRLRHWCARPSRTYIEFNQPELDELVADWNKRA